MWISIATILNPRRKNICYMSNGIGSAESVFDKEYSRKRREIPGHEWDLKTKTGAE